MVIEKDCPAWNFDLDLLIFDEFPPLSFRGLLKLLRSLVPPMAKKVEFQSKNMIFRVFSEFSEQAMEKIEIPRWTKVFFYMLEHCP